MGGETQISIRSLCEFLLRSGSIDARFSGLDRGLQGGRIHRRLQKQGGPGYLAEVPLALDVEMGGFVFRLNGRADGVITEEDGITVDEIKTISTDPELLDEDKQTPLAEEMQRAFSTQKTGERLTHWAQGCCYAHILCVQRGLAQISVRLTYFGVETGTLRRFTRKYTAAELAVFMQEMLTQYLRWAQLKQELVTRRDTSLQKLKFPFDGYRDGQRQLAIGVYQTCKNGGRLFACAPTGIGKTVSTLFPALKAMGEGYGERIFYLTAKTITRTAAEQALTLLREKGGVQVNLRNITLTAKDKICFLDERACMPETCEWAAGYYDRVNNALYEILQTETLFTREHVERLAKKHHLCPYELSLDLSLWCDVITCDYNYLFDPVVHLQRFFEGKGGENVFLIDEAHNLLDRAREMYSAGLEKSAFSSFKKKLSKLAKRLHKALAELNKGFIALRKQCEEAEGAALTLYAPPDELAEPMEKFLAATEAFLEDNRGSEIEQDLLALYFTALFYNRIAEEYADNYITLLSLPGKDVKVRLFCLDPADFLDETMKKGRASVLFSATLQPLPYYKETLGGGTNAKLLVLPSPFVQRNLGLFVAGSVSTKFTDRDASLAKVVGMLANLAQSRPGNYIVYFPSYGYMRQVLDKFEESYPTVPTLVQQPGMNEAAREDFLAAFSPRPQGTLLGFCVLGGIFSEGVDLTGDRLIGTAVVGVGLPQIGPEPDAIRRYWDDKESDGFAYAYQFPGMNKVMQAAGRVIRGPEEAGVVLLIDSRFPSRRYQNIFPPHWSHWRAVNSGNIHAEMLEYWQGIGTE